jgi:hypothetical protein
MGNGLKPEIWVPDDKPEAVFGGWGQEILTDSKKLYNEQKSVDTLQRETGLVCSVADAVGGTQPKIIEKVKSQFKFDEGWDFMVAERMVYNMTADQTLMVTQNIGNCVGDSHCCDLAARIAHEIVFGDGDSPLGSGNMGVPFIAFSYGVGRMEGNMLRGGDGSYCGAQMSGTLKWGFLAADEPGLEVYGSLPQGSAASGRLFGRSKAEIMKWTDKAAKLKLTEAPRAKTAQDVVDGITKKFMPFQICSGQGFVYKGFDSKYGVHLYVPGGRWSHSMQLVAAFAIKGQWFVVIRNQWGQNKHKGSPEIGIAGGCMVITLETLERWMRSSECMAIGEIKGRREKLAA